MPTPEAFLAYRRARDFLLNHRDDYESAYQEFTWPDVGGHFNWALDWFDVIARDNDKVALWITEEDGSERKYTYADMAARSDKVALWLRENGVTAGDHVMLMLENQIELWELMLAVIKLGAVIMPTTTVLGPHELVDRVDRGAVDFVVARTEDTAKFDEVPGSYRRIVVGKPVNGWFTYADAGSEEATPDSVMVSDRLSTTASTDPVLIYFTSGTTNKPKIAVHSHLSYPVGHLSTMYWIGVRPGDVHMVISSPGWGKHAWSSFFAPWIAEATIFVYNYTRFDPHALEEQLLRAGVNTFCAPPTVWRMLLQQKATRGPGNLRELLSAGEPLDPEVIAQFRDRWGLTIRDGYGQTEMTAIVGNTPCIGVKAGAMGRPLPGAAVVLLDRETELPIPDGPTIEAEICLDLSAHPVNLMTGYLNDPGRNARTHRGGFFHTGDVVSRDDEGIFTFVGRVDDIFKSSDFKVSPFEVESVLLEHPAVAAAAVVPAPDPVRFAITKAYVTLAADWPENKDTAFEVMKYARANLPPYMRVRRLEFAELPRTVSNKIRRIELRMREESLAEQGVVPDGEWRERDFPHLKKKRK